MRLRRTRSLQQRKLHKPRKHKSSSGYVTAKTTVNVRKSASETGEKLEVIYQGERLELMMNQADGWCKVKYRGQTAYDKSEFVE